MNESNKWSGLAGEGCLIRDLGRPAIFLIPSKKLDLQWAGGTTIRERLHGMLTLYFGAYTTSLIPSFGVYTSDAGTRMLDECVEYEVSFAGKDKIPLLTSELGLIAEAIAEECIYLKAGQYACLVYPT